MIPDRIRMMSVDPGLGGTGISVWSGKRLESATVITAPRGEEWDVRAIWYAQAVYDKAVNEVVSDVVIEMPQYMQSAGGQLTARANSLVKLTTLVGCMLFALSDEERRVHLITPTKWKGQLPKPAMVKRIQARIPKACARIMPMTHAWDAIGLGLYFQGRF